MTSSLLCELACLFHREADATFDPYAFPPRQDYGSPDHLESRRLAEVGFALSRRAAAVELAPGAQLSIW